MSDSRRWLHSVLIVLIIHSTVFVPISAEERADKPIITGEPVLWQEPTDIASRNLLHGPGGMQNAPPRGPFRFIKEDLDGTQPKFDVVDPNGVQWKVKVGPEARSETVATRFLWAVGYYADEDYFVPSITVESMPIKLERGEDYVEEGVVLNARLERERKHKKIDVWKWKENPFAGTRELNGLRVLAVLMNNSDLKDSNNAILEAKDESCVVVLEFSCKPRLIYMLSDVGATFGGTGWRWPGQAPKGDLEAYAKTKFISKVEPGEVDFKSPTQPMFVYFTGIPLLFSRVRTGWIGRDVPLEDARWMGSLLARLTPEQIRDAFRAGGFSPEEVEGFAQIVENRIAELNAL